MVRYQDFIHPEDEAARKYLEGIPGFTTVTKYFLEQGMEKQLHGMFMAEKIRLSPTQIPELYNKLVPIVKKFDIQEPEFYLEMNRTPNAYTTGDKQTFIVVTSGLLETCNDEEILAILAHECGHILCRHVFYKTIAMFLFYAADALGVVGKLAAPIQYALNYWSRRSELSADRAALVYAGNTEPMTNALLRITGGPESLTGKINIDEYARQAQHYYDLCDNSKWHKILQSLAVMNNSHPFTAVRVSELQKWSKSNEFMQLHENMLKQGNMQTCSNCGKNNDGNNKFCRFCGKKL